MCDTATGLAVALSTIRSVSFGATAAHKNKMTHRVAIVSLNAQMG